MSVTVVFKLDLLPIGKVLRGIFLTEKLATQFIDGQVELGYKPTHFLRETWFVIGADAIQSEQDDRVLSG